MAIRDFDRPFANELVDRLRKLPPDRQPRWGSLKAAELVPHLTQVLRYTMGKTGPLPFVGSWLTRRIIGPLVLRGLVRIPKNIDLPQPAPEPGAVDADACLETFHAVLEEYLDRVQSGDLSPEPHVLFGDIGVDGWARMHVVHFEHHLRQFEL